MHRKFIKSGYQWGRVSTKNKSRSRTHYIKKPHLMSRRPENHHVDEEDDHFVKEATDDNQYEEMEEYYDYFRFKYNTEYHASKQVMSYKVARRIIQKGNADDLKHLFSSRYLKQIFHKKCHLCMTSDETIKKYLIIVEEASPCRSDFYCGGYSLYREFQKNKSIFLPPLLNVQQYQEIEKMYRGECPLCLTTDTRIHRLMIDNYHIHICRKYDCLGYDQYMWSTEFSQTLSLLFSISRHHPDKLFIDKNPIMGEILYLTTQMIDDTFRELLYTFNTIPNNSIK